MAVTKSKKKVVKKVSHGIAHVVATNNNTRITITDQSGAVLAWATAGANNFKGAKKSTPYAATVVADAVGKKVAEMGMKTVDVLMRGIGQGRESAVRGQRTQTNARTRKGKRVVVAGSATKGK